MSIQIEKIGKLFGRTQVLKDISLDIASGEMVALLGPSGSGKTTLLRIIAGLEQHSHGLLRFHGQDVSRIHAKDRHVGFVFQHYALFRHMTVFDNVAFGLTVMPRKQRPSSQAIKQKVMQLLDMVQLAHLASRYPSQLSVVIFLVDLLRRLLIGCHNCARHNGLCCIGRFFRFTLSD